MTPTEAVETFAAVRASLKTKYDYWKYGGRGVKADYVEKKHPGIGYRLCKVYKSEREIRLACVNVTLEKGSDKLWVTDIMEENIIKKTRDIISRVDQLEEYLGSDISRLQLLYNLEGTISAFRMFIRDGEFGSPLLKYLLQGRINFVTFALICDLTNCHHGWRSSKWSFYKKDFDTAINLLGLTVSHRAAAASILKQYFI